MSRFFCLHISDFPAWAAVLHQPSLRGKPLVITARRRIVALSPLAQQAGLQTGWPVVRAEALAPEAIVLAQDAAQVFAAWEQLLGALYEVTPCIESIRPGLAFASLDNSSNASSHNSTKSASSLVPLLRRWQEQEALAHGGLADDRTTAHLAALTAGPGKLRSIKPGRSSAFLQRVALRHLSQAGVSENTIERLGLFGYSTVAHLQRLTKAQLVAQFPEGELLYRVAQVKDVRPVATYSPPPVVHVRYAFDAGATEPGEWMPVLAQLVDEAHLQLGQRLAQSLTVSIETRRGWQRQQHLLREPMNAVPLLQFAAQRAVDALLQSTQHSHQNRPCTALNPWGYGAEAFHSVPDHKAFLHEAFANEAGTEVCAIELQLGGLMLQKPVQNSLFDGHRFTRYRAMRQHFTRQRFSDSSGESPAVAALLRSCEVRFPGALRRIVITNPDAYLPEDGFYYAPLNVPLDASPKKSRLEKGRSENSRTTRHHRLCEVRR